MMSRKPGALLLATLILLAAAIPAFAASGSTIVYITETGKKYHNEGCSSLRQSCIEKTLAEAVGLGLEPCGKCHPPVLDSGEIPVTPADPTPVTPDPVQPDPEPTPDPQDDPTPTRTTPQSVTISSDYGLPVISSGDFQPPLIGDYDGTAEPVSDYILNYDPTRSGLQTVTVTIYGETIQTQAIIYNSAKEQFFDFGDAVDADPTTEQSFAVLYDARGRFLGLTDILVLDNHEIALIPNDFYASTATIKLITINTHTFAPAAEAVEGF